MTPNDGPVIKQRNRNYDETHLLLIAKAGGLILDSGANGVSVSALARITGLNRSTIYYHFGAREALMSAAQKWSREQLGGRGDGEVSRRVGIDRLSAIFQRGPGVISLWLNNYLAGGDVRERYPQWDRLVAQISDAFAELSSDTPCDVEVYCALFLTSASIVPGLFTDSKHPIENLKCKLGQAVHQSSDASCLAVC